jgi:hypothetical protein
MTKKDKAEKYDAIAAKVGNLELALFDLVNSRFEFPVIVRPIDMDKDFGSGRYRVQMSYRSMPLFLVRYQQGCQADSVEVLTEDQIQEGYRRHPLSLYWRVMMQARNECMRKRDEKERRAS